MRNLFWLTVFTLTIYGCGSKENPDPQPSYSVENGTLTIDASYPPAPLVWLVTVTDAAAKTTSALCDAGPISITLPKGRWKVSCVGFLPPDRGRETSGYRRISHTVEIASSPVTAVTVAGISPPRVQVAALPRHFGKLVRLRGVAGGKENPVMAELGKPLNAAGYPGKFAPCFADETGTVLAPKVYAPISGFPPAFVANDVLAVYDEIDAPLYPQGPTWKGRTLYIYEFTPTGLYEFPARVMDQVATSVDPESPLPAGKNKELSTEYHHSVRYIQEYLKK